MPRENANSDQFREAADDFDRYFAISSFQDIINYLIQLVDEEGLDVNEIYIFDHSGINANSDVTGLYFGDEWIPNSQLEKAISGIAPFTTDDATINLRHCYFGNRTELMIDIATASNRAITASKGKVTQNGPRIYDPNAEEIDGPEYRLGGDLMLAPAGGGQVQTIWTPRSRHWFWEDIVVNPPHY